MYKRFLLAPDSFKGTMTAQEVCQIQRAAILEIIPDAQVDCLPLADGGEGMADAWLNALGGERIELTVTGPMGKPVPAHYALLQDGSAAIEMAAAAGLALVEGELDPCAATTLGVGEIILDAKARGARRILLGLGGSATNDMGAGMAAALGWRFLDANGNAVEPRADRLGAVCRVVAPEKALDLEITAACDVRNPLLGENGATAIYGPQKGVTAQLRPMLEAGLENLSALLEALTGRALRDIPGAGAAGGLGAGVLGFLNGSLKPGVEMLLDAAHFDERLQHIDMVFTGEGRMDGQSINGKLPMGVGLRCKAAGVPCIALCGSLGPSAEKMAGVGILASFSAVQGCCDFEQVKHSCRDDMAQLTRNVVRVLKGFALKDPTKGALPPWIPCQRG